MLSEYLAVLGALYQLHFVVQAGEVLRSWATVVGRGCPICRKLCQEGNGVWAGVFC